MKHIDNFLNALTMYRLVLYGLTILTIIAIVFSFFGWVSFSPLGLGASLLILLASCFVSNFIFGKVFNAIQNLESVYITAFILFFVMAPVVSLHDAYILAIVGGISMASKYLLAIGKKHIFNPVAIAVLAVGLFGSGAGIWWVGTPSLALPVVIFGFLILRKTRRFELFFSFAVVAILVALAQTSMKVELLQQIALSWPIWFLGTVMLTEPLTTPYTKRLQIIYGAIVGFLFSFQFHIGPIYLTPEFALVIGNIFAYVVSPKQKLKLYFESFSEVAPNIFDFSFKTDKKLKFTAGQYLEWTLPLGSQIAGIQDDTRGNRRYFTIASSPTDENIYLGVRVDKEKGSTFKKKLMALQKGDVIMAGQLAGEFVLPKDSTQKLIFIAGGIGITPFYSMIQYLSAMKEKRDIVLLYTCLTSADFAYKAEIDKMKDGVGLKAVYIPTTTAGFITKEMLEREVSDYHDRAVYISGPNVMVKNYKKLFLSIGQKRGLIHTDYFPGY